MCGGVSIAHNIALYVCVIVTLRHLRYERNYFQKRKWNTSLTQLRKPLPSGCHPLLWHSNSAGFVVSSASLLAVLHYFRSRGISIDERTFCIKSTCFVLILQQFLGTSKLPIQSC